VGDLLSKVNGKFTMGWWPFPPVTYQGYPSSSGFGDVFIGD